MEVRVYFRSSGHTYRLTTGWQPHANFLRLNVSVPVSHVQLYSQHEVRC